MPVCQCCRSSVPIPNWLRQHWQLAALAMATPSHWQGFHIGDPSPVAHPSPGGAPVVPFPVARRPIPRCPSSHSPLPFIPLKECLERGRRLRRSPAWRGSGRFSGLCAPGVPETVFAVSNFMCGKPPEMRAFPRLRKNMKFFSKNLLHRRPRFDILFTRCATQGDARCDATVDL